MIEAQKNVDNSGQVSSTSAGCDVSVIIVSYNTRLLTLDCLRSVFEQTRASTLEVIVVDNASSDGSAEAIRAECPSAKLIANQQNRGFAAANNQGLRIARGRYPLLLNPDTVVLDRAIDRMVEYMDAHSDIGCAGCQVLSDETTIQRTCFRFPSPLNIFLTVTGLQRLFPRSRFFGRYSMGRWDRQSEHDVDVVSGMFMMLRREALEQVGFMDEDYFVYAEEADWCYRCWRAKWRCVFTPYARIIHLEGGGKSTSQVKTRMYVQLQKSILLFHRKNLGSGAYWAARLFFGLAMMVRALFAGLSLLLRRDAASRSRLDQSIAAIRLHSLGLEPQQ